LVADVVRVIRLAHIFVADVSGVGVRAGLHFRELALQGLAGFFLIGLAGRNANLLAMVVVLRPPNLAALDLE
jgi:hypothetical protein